MPQTEFTPESLSSQMRRVWRENKGNWLLATGVIVAVIAGAVGYFRLLPEFNAVRRPNASVWTGGKRLTVHVVGCDGDKGEVVAMLYDAATLSENSVPMRLELLAISEEQAEWVINNLAYGKYAVYAFQDLDGNEKVDAPLERQGITMSSTTLPSSGQSSFNFSQAAFEFSPVSTEVTLELR